MAKQAILVVGVAAKRVDAATANQNVEVAEAAKQEAVAANRVAAAAAATAAAAARQAEAIVGANGAPAKAAKEEAAVASQAATVASAMANVAVAKHAAAEATEAAKRVDAAVAKSDVAAAKQAAATAETAAVVAAEAVKQVVAAATTATGDAVAAAKQAVAAAETAATAAEKQAKMARETANRAAAGGAPSAAPSAAPTANPNDYCQYDNYAFSGEKTVSSATTLNDAMLICNKLSDCTGFYKMKDDQKNDIYYFSGLDERGNEKLFGHYGNKYKAWIKKDKAKDVKFITASSAYAINNTTIDNIKNNSICKPPDPVTTSGFTPYRASYMSKAEPTNVVANEDGISAITGNSIIGAALYNGGSYMLMK